MAAKKMPIVNFVKKDKLKNNPERKSKIGFSFCFSLFFIPHLVLSNTKYTPNNPNVNASGSVNIRPVCIMNIGVKLKINDDMIAILLLKTFSAILYNNRIAVNENTKSKTLPQATGLNPSFQNIPNIVG